MDEDNEVYDELNDEPSSMHSQRLLEATLQKAQKARKPSYKANYKTTTRKEASTIFQ